MEKTINQEICKLMVEVCNDLAKYCNKKGDKNLKSFLEKVSDKDIDMLSSDYDDNPNKLSKNQIKLMLDVATELYGKDTFTQKQLEPFMSEANVWFVLEKLRREGLVKIDNKGVPHRTRLGHQVNKYMEKHNEVTADSSQP